MKYSHPTQVPTPKLYRWKQSWRLYCQSKIFTLFFLGFSSGLPYALVFSTLSLWLREAHIDLSLIGFFSWIGLLFAFKCLWAPAIDYLPLPVLTRYLGRRRGWLIISQCVVCISCIGLSFSNPETDLSAMMYWTIALSISTATQETVSDAYRIESENNTASQALLSAAYQTGYRLALLCSGAGAIWMVSIINGEQYDLYGWHIAYFSMGILSIVGLITTCLIQEPTPSLDDWGVDKKTWIFNSPLFKKMPSLLIKWLTSFYTLSIYPFMEFLIRYKKQSIYILLLISLYRISDTLIHVMINPFYYDIGFTKQQIVMISKLYGVFMSISGVMVTGLLIHYFPIKKILYTGSILACFGNFIFAMLSAYGKPSILALTVIISIDNFSGGLASCVFMVWLSKLTHKRYVASQYALFYGLMLFIPKFIGGFSGIFVEHCGYTLFFIGSGCLGIPVLALIYLIKT